MTDARVCDGYGVWGGGGKPYGPNGYKSTTSRARSHLLATLPRPMAGRVSRDQQTTFEMLRLRMGIKFSGVFESGFWDQLILQASLDEPGIMHAVAAIGRAYRSDRLARHGHDTWASNGAMDEEGARALRKYGKAISCLKDHLEHPDTFSLRVTLITCMLFVCFEYLRRNLRAGDTHLRNGLRILLNVHTAQSQDMNSIVVAAIPPQSVDDHLLEAFSRLSLQCTLFCLQSQHIYIAREESPFDISEVFDTPDQARRHLDRLLGGAYHLLLKRCEGERAETGTHDLDAFLRHQHQLKTELSRWLQVLHNTTDQPIPRLITKLAYDVLCMYHSMATIIVSVIHPNSPEMDFDAHNADFSSIIAQSKAISDKEKLFRSLTPAYFTARKSFTIDMGYIPVMYYTALKCRLPWIRRQAMQVMRASPHREGVWDGVYTAAIARRVVQIEEADLYTRTGFDPDERYDGSYGPQPQGCGWEELPTVPEESRIHQVMVVLPAEGTARTTLMCMRRQWVDGAGWRLESRNYIVQTPDISDAVGA